MLDILQVHQAIMRSESAFILSCLTMLAGCTNLQHAESERLNEQGVQYLVSNDLPKAHAKFTEAWKKDPQNAETLYNLASTYQRHGQDAEAERYYRQSLQLNPNLDECRHNFYLLLVSENRLPEARDDAQAWLTKNPKSADAYTEVGWLTRMQGDLPGARKNLEQALTIEPHHAQALIETGKLYQDYQMNDRARGLYQRVLLQDPTNKEAKDLLTALPKK
jgi:Tfp pilus assembly protein PilF